MQSVWKGGEQGCSFPCALTHRATWNFSIIVAIHTSKKSSTPEAVRYSSFDACYCRLLHLPTLYRPDQVLATACTLVAALATNRAPSTVSSLETPPPERHTPQHPQHNRRHLYIFCPAQRPRRNESQLPRPCLSLQRAYAKGLAGQPIAGVEPDRRASIPVSYRPLRPKKTSLGGNISAF